MPVPDWLKKTWQFVQPRGPAGSRTGGRPLYARPSPFEDDTTWFWPPSTVTDAAAWDQYWQDQVSHGVEAFVYLFVMGSATELVGTLQANQLTRVLFIGSGVSQEPRAFARVGFDVTALDLSPWAMATARDQVVPDAFLAKIVGGRPATAGGRVAFVAGDLMDAAVCPGPYDAVIDRKTLQLFSDEDLPAAMRRTADRLAARGLFFSQSHDACWKPPATPRNRTRDWFTKEGWALHRPSEPISGRVALPMSSTG